MRCPASFRLTGVAMLAAAILAAPMLAEADSQMQTAAARHTAAATAHVDFRIIIPKVLSLALDRSADPGRGAPSVAIGSNGHTVSLAATARGSDDARSDIILSAGARRNIVQDAACALRNSRPPTIDSAHAGVIGDSRRTICTVSMP